MVSVRGIRVQQKGNRNRSKFRADQPGKTPDQKLRYLKIHQDPDQASTLQSAMNELINREARGHYHSPFEKLLFFKSHP